MPSTRIVSSAVSAPANANGGQAPGRVLVICPGGLENGGGIGRQMGYFLGADATGHPALTYSVLDSRGPWFLGASKRHRLLSGFYLLKCLAGCWGHG